MDDDGCGGNVVATKAVVDMMLDWISGSGGSDAGWDAGLDAGSDAEVDAGSDAVSNAGLDAGLNA